MNFYGYDDALGERMAQWMFDRLMSRRALYHNYDVNIQNHPQYDLRMDATMICTAYDVSNGKTHVGYSGVGSTVVGVNFPERDRRRRVRRVANALGYDVPEVLSHLNDGWTCAEIMAINNALSKGAQTSNLIFCTVSNEHGQVADPCQNCLDWMGKAFGYVRRKHSPPNLGHPQGIELCDGEEGQLVLFG